MRILLLTTSFPVTQGSSSGAFVERLARQLGKYCPLQVLAPATPETCMVRDDRPYRLSTFRYAPRRWQLLAHGGGGIPVTIVTYPWLKLLVPVFLVSMMIACMRNARQADLIFANWSICGVIAGIAGKIMGKPVITTVRGEDANRAGGSWKHRMLISLCLRLGCRVVTVSDDIALQLKSTFARHAPKIVMIPNGVDLELGEKSQAKKNPGDKISIIVVGSLIKRKSIHTVLEALAKLPARYHLVLVGEGPERDALKSLANDLGVGARTNFVGSVPPEEIPEWLSEADVLVMSSESEGRPNAVLEGMAASLAVIGSDIPGIRELIVPGETGFIFPVGDVDALVSCLKNIEDRGYRNCLGMAARQAIIDRDLTWERCAEEYHRLFETVLSGKAC